jgi:hypothetical protein
MTTLRIGTYAGHYTITTSQPIGTYATTKPR